MITPTARGAMTIDMSGRVLYQKDPDTPHNLMSITKCMTGYLVYKHQIPHGQEVVVTSADIVGGTSMRLQAGDIVTVRDLLYGMMMPSGNDAGRTLGRIVGQKLLDDEGATGDALTRHVQEMNAQGVAWGWAPGFAFAGPSGHPNQSGRVSARQVVDLWRRSVADYPDYRDVAGTLTHQAQVTGPNARTLSLTHTINPNGSVPFPEFISGKTGSVAGSNPARSAVYYWSDPDSGDGRVSVILATPSPDPARYVEMRAQMDYVISNPAPRSGLLTIGGKSPVSMSINGRPVQAVKLGGTILFP